MPVGTLCFTLLVAFVAINQSLANPTSDGIPYLTVNNNNSILINKLGSSFEIPCFILTKSGKSEYEPRWQTNGGETIETGTDEPILLGEPGWYIRSYLKFTKFQATQAGKWTCELWSRGEQKVKLSESVDLVIEEQDQIPWAVQFEKNVTVYHIKKGESINWTLIINTTEPNANFTTSWHWPNKTGIEPTLNHTEERFGAFHKIRRNFTLSNVIIDGNYTVNVSRNNEPAKTLTAIVSFKSDASNTTSKPNGSTTKSPAPSSGIRIESSFLALVVAWFACRSVAFGGTA